MDQADVVRLVHIMRLVTYFDVSASTLFVWDYMLTFRMEVDLVWKSKWTFMKGLYLFQRYLPFIDTAWLVLYRQTGGNLTRTACWDTYHASGVLMIVGLAASEMILTIRTWAVWNRNRRLSIILPILYALVWGSCFFFLSKFLNSLRSSDPPYPGFKGCFVTHASKDLNFLWVLLAVWNTMVLMLMLIPAVRTYRSGGENGRLFKTVYRDGLIYYLYLFALALANVIVIATLPSQFQEPLTVMERVIHSMLASRVLLEIRAQAGEDRDASYILTEIRYNPPSHLSTSEEQA
ncbi:hypothetical protein M413DRAFT_443118 [Hebeloma cylindrosporum]|uniref:DUF6533 domain-containing protein n=1 Tax=Hebeloma cylindrosporum TaxID=76867 RepID=A0A0C2YSS5_HEBCY|nr:hypothetical protein M413DRAFT_443118 [Hebeloma cylindrosporum h7]